MTDRPSRSSIPGGSEFATGELVAGKFRVERVVGRGGMGIVVEATNVQLDQRVALKFLARDATDPAIVERFTNEARAAARLRSEHVARVFDVGKDALRGPFIVMEMLEGKTLAELVTEGGRIPVHRAAEYVIDACEGLAEAHARGIVHRDVKPGNLFLVTGDDGRPTIKLLDFGIATMRTKDEATTGKSGSLKSAGTPAYLCPEQLRGAPEVDLRADVWALGCVLYELVAGERAFRAARFTELVTHILESPPDPLPADLDLPPTLLGIIDRCLEKDREKRYVSTGELALALLPLARRRAHSSVAKAVSHVKAAGLDPALQMPSSMPPPPESGSDALSVPHIPIAGVPSFSSIPARREPSAPAPARGSVVPVEAPRKRAPVVPIVVVLLLLAGGGAFAFLRRGASETPPTLPSASATTPASVPAASASAVPSGAAAPSEAPAPTPAPSETGEKVPTAPSSHRRPRPRPSAATPGSVAPSATDSEIRMNR